MFVLFFFQSNFRCLFFDFIKTTVLFSNFFKTKTVIDVFEKKITKRFLFRRCKNTIKSIQIFDKQTLINNIFRFQIINFENVINIKFFIDLYIFRRNNKQVFNNNNK